MQLITNLTSPYGRIARISMIEKGMNIEPTIVDPWSDDARLRAANAATRVPTLITDEGMALTESVLIVHWLEQTRPAPLFPSLLGNNATCVLSRTGAAIGVIDAAVHTIICRKITAPALFDETPIGLRRRRTMAEGMRRLEADAARTPMDDHSTPTLDAIAVTVALDYLRFRFADATWLAPLPALESMSQRLRKRDSFAITVPR